MKTGKLTTAAKAAALAAFCGFVFACQQTSMPEDYVIAKPAAKASDVGPEVAGVIAYGYDGTAYDELVGSASGVPSGDHRGEMILNIDLDKLYSSGNPTFPDANGPNAAPTGLWLRPLFSATDADALIILPLDVYTYHGIEQTAVSTYVSPEVPRPVGDGWQAITALFAGHEGSYGDVYALMGNPGTWTPGTPDTAMLQMQAEFKKGFNYGRKTYSPGGGPTPYPPNQVLLADAAGPASGMKIYLKNTAGSYNYKFYAVNKVGNVRLYELKVNVTTTANGRISAASLPPGSPTAWLGSQTWTAALTAGSGTVPSGSTYWVQATEFLPAADVPQAHSGNVTMKGPATFIGGFKGTETDKDGASGRDPAVSAGGPGSGKRGQKTSLSITGDLIIQDGFVTLEDIDLAVSGTITFTGGGGLRLLNAQVDAGGTIEMQANTYLELTYSGTPYGTKSKVTASGNPGIKNINSALVLDHGEIEGTIELNGPQASLTMKDIPAALTAIDNSPSKITGSGGTGVTVGGTSAATQGSTFTMEGGVIGDTGAGSYFAIAVLVNTRGKFDMQGGTIRYNNLGVELAQGAMFNKDSTARVTDNIGGAFKDATLELEASPAYTGGAAAYTAGPPSYVTWPDGTDTGSVAFATDYDKTSSAFSGGTGWTSAPANYAIVITPSAQPARVKIPVALTGGSFRSTTTPGTPDALEDWVIYLAGDVHFIETGASGAKIDVLNSRLAVIDLSVTTGIGTGAAVTAGATPTVLVIRSSKLANTATAAYLPEAESTNITARGQSSNAITVSITSGATWMPVDYLEANKTRMFGLNPANVSDGFYDIAADPVLYYLDAGSQEIARSDTTNPGSVTLATGRLATETPAFVRIQDGGPGFYLSTSQTGSYPSSNSQTVTISPLAFASLGASPAIAAKAESVYSPVVAVDKTSGAQPIVGTTPQDGIRLWLGTGIVATAWTSAFTVNNVGVSSPASVSANDYFEIFDVFAGASGSAPTTNGFALVPGVAGGEVSKATLWYDSSAAAPDPQYYVELTGLYVPTATHNFKIRGKENAFGAQPAAGDLKAEAVTLAPTRIKLTDGSYGVPGNGEITGLTATKKYVINSGSDWHYTDTNGELSGAGSYEAAVTGANALNAGVTDITSGSGSVPYTGAFVNGNTYAVYEVAEAGTWFDAGAMTYGEFPITSTTRNTIILLLRGSKYTNGYSSHAHTSPGIPYEQVRIYLDPGASLTAIPPDVKIFMAFGDGQMTQAVTPSPPTSLINVQPGLTLGTTSPNPIGTLADQWTLETTSIAYLNAAANTPNVVLNYPFFSASGMNTQYVSLKEGSLAEHSDFTFTAALGDDYIEVDLPSASATWISDILQTGAATPLAITSGQQNFFTLTAVSPAAGYSVTNGANGTAITKLNQTTPGANVRVRIENIGTVTTAGSFTLTIKKEALNPNGVNGAGVIGNDPRTAQVYSKTTLRTAQFAAPSTPAMTDSIVVAMTASVGSAWQSGDIPLAVPPGALPSKAQAANYFTLSDAGGTSVTIPSTASIRFVNGASDVNVVIGDLVQSGASLLTAGQDYIIAAKPGAFTDDSAWAPAFTISATAKPLQEANVTASDGSGTTIPQGVDSITVTSTVASLWNAAITATPVAANGLFSVAAGSGSGLTVLGTTTVKLIDSTHVLIENLGPVAAGGGAFTLTAHAGAFTPATSPMASFTITAMGEVPKTSVSGYNTLTSSDVPAGDALDYADAVIVTLTGASAAWSAALPAAVTDPPVLASQFFTVAPYSGGSQAVGGFGVNAGTIVRRIAADGSGNTRMLLERLTPASTAGGGRGDFQVTALPAAFTTASAGTMYSISAAPKNPTVAVMTTVSSLAVAIEVSLSTTPSAVSWATAIPSAGAVGASPYFEVIYTGSGSLTAADFAVDSGTTVRRLSNGNVLIEGLTPTGLAAGATDEWTLKAKETAFDFTSGNEGEEITLTAAPEDKKTADETPSPTPIGSTRYSLLVTLSATGSDTTVWNSVIPAGGEPVPAAQYFEFEDALVLTAMATTPAPAPTVRRLDATHVYIENLLTVASPSTDYTLIAKPSVFVPDYGATRAGYAITAALKAPQEAFLTDDDTASGNSTLTTGLNSIVLTIVPTSGLPDWQGNIPAGGQSVPAATFFGTGTTVVIGSGNVLDFTNATVRRLTPLIAGQSRVIIENIGGVSGITTNDIHKVTALPAAFNTASDPTAIYTITGAVKDLPTVTTLAIATGTNAIEIGLDDGTAGSVAANAAVGWASISTNPMPAATYFALTLNGSDAGIDLTSATVRRLTVKQALGKPILLIENIGSAAGSSATITITAKANTSSSSSPFSSGSAAYPYGITAAAQVPPIAVISNPPVGTSAIEIGLNDGSGGTLSGAGVDWENIPSSPGTAPASTYFTITETSTVGFSFTNATVRKLNKTDGNTPPRVYLLIENIGSATAATGDITITPNARVGTASPPTMSPFAGASADYSYGITAAAVAKTASITGPTGVGGTQPAAGDTGIVVTLSGGTWSTDIPVNPLVGAAGSAADYFAIQTAGGGFSLANATVRNLSGGKVFIDGLTAATATTAYTLVALPGAFTPTTADGTYSIIAASRAPVAYAAAAMTDVVAIALTGTAGITANFNSTVAALTAPVSASTYFTAAGSTSFTSAFAGATMRYLSAAQVLIEFNSPLVLTAGDTLTAMTDAFLASADIGNVITLTGAERQAKSALLPSSGPGAAASTTDSVVVTLSSGSGEAWAPVFGGIPYVTLPASTYFTLSAMGDTGFDASAGTVTVRAVSATELIIENLSSISGSGSAYTVTANPAVFAAANAAIGSYSAWNITAEARDPITFTVEGVDTGDDTLEINLPSNVWHSSINTTAMPVPANWFTLKPDSGNSVGQGLDILSTSTIEQASGSTTKVIIKGLREVGAGGNGEWTLTVKPDALATLGTITAVSAATAYQAALTTVLVTNGSYGTGATGQITGLPSGLYIFHANGGSWYGGAIGSGTSPTAYPTREEAIEASLVATADTIIDDLVDGRTYDVYRVIAMAPSGSPSVNSSPPSKLAVDKRLRNTLIQVAVTSPTTVNGTLAVGPLAAADGSTGDGLPGGFAYDANYAGMPNGDVKILLNFGGTDITYFDGVLTGTARDAVPLGTTASSNEKWFGGPRASWQIKNNSTADNVSVGLRDGDTVITLASAPQTNTASTVDLTLRPGIFLDGGTNGQIYYGDTPWTGSSANADEGEKGLSITFSPTATTMANPATTGDKVLVRKPASGGFLATMDTTNNYGKADASLNFGAAGPVGAATAEAPRTGLGRGEWYKAYLVKTDFTTGYSVAAGNSYDETLVVDAADPGHVYGVIIDASPQQLQDHQIKIIPPSSTMGPIPQGEVILFMGDQNGNKSAATATVTPAPYVNTTSTTVVPVLAGPQFLDAENRATVRMDANGVSGNVVVDTQGSAPTGNDRFFSTVYYQSAVTNPASDTIVITYRGKVGDTLVTPPTSGGYQWVQAANPVKDGSGSTIAVTYGTTKWDSGTYGFNGASSLVDSAAAGTYIKAPPGPTFDYQLGLVPVYYLNGTSSWTGGYEVPSDIVPLYASATGKSTQVYFTINIPATDSYYFGGATDDEYKEFVLLKNVNTSTGDSLITVTKTYISDDGKTLYVFGAITP